MYASTESASTKSKPTKDELVQAKHHTVPLPLSLLASFFFCRRTKNAKKARRPISTAAIFFSPEGLRGLHNGTSTARRHTHALHSTQQPIPAGQRRRGCKIAHAKHTKGKRGGTLFPLARRSLTKAYHCCGPKPSRSSRSKQSPQLCL